MILSRYIVREHVGPFFFGLFLIIFIFTMNLMIQMMRKIAGKGLQIMVILEFFALNLAWILALAVPMSVLISTIAAYGRMSGDGEITAMRASGISAWQMIRPGLIASFFVALWVAWFNNFVLPDMNHRTKLLQIDISRKKPTLTVESNVYAFHIPKYVLHAREVDQERSLFFDVTIYDEHIPNERSVISARKGHLRFVAAEEMFLMKLYSGEIHRPSDREPASYEWTSFDSASFRISAPGMVLKRGSEGYRGDRELSVAELLNRIEELKSSDKAEHNVRRINSYWVEVHKKFSIPAACLVFILIGAPLGILSHKGGMGVASGISLLFFTIYWAFLYNGERFADRGFVPPAIAMWFANVLLMVTGIWFIRIAKLRTTIPGTILASELFSRLGRLLWKARRMPGEEN